MSRTSSVFQGGAHHQVPPLLLRLLRDRDRLAGSRPADSKESSRDYHFLFFDCAPFAAPSTRERVCCLLVLNSATSTPAQWHNQDKCAVAYADDGYIFGNIKAKQSIALEVLSDIRVASMYSRRTLASPSISTRLRFSFTVFLRLMRTLPHIACSMQILPSRTSVPCSLQRPLQLTSTLALGCVNYGGLIDTLFTDVPLFTYDFRLIDFLCQSYPTFVVSSSPNAPLVQKKWMLGSFFSGEKWEKNNLQLFFSRIFLILVFSEQNDFWAHFFWEKWTLCLLSKTINFEWVVVTRIESIIWSFFAVKVIDYRFRFLQSIRSP